MARIITVGAVSVVTSEHVIDSITRRDIVRVEVEDHTVAAGRRTRGGRSGDRGSRAPEKQAVHISQRTLWHTAVYWLCRAEGVDRASESGRDAVGNRCHYQPNRQSKRNDHLRFSRIHDCKRV